MRSFTLSLLVLFWTAGCSDDEGGHRTILADDFSSFPTAQWEAPPSNTPEVDPPELDPEMGNPAPSIDFASSSVRAIRSIEPFILSGRLTLNLDVAVDTEGIPDFAYERIDILIEGSSGTPQLTLMIFALENDPTDPYPGFPPGLSYSASLRHGTTELTRVDLQPNADWHRFEVVIGKLGEGLGTIDGVALGYFPPGTIVPDAPAHLRIRGTQVSFFGGGGNWGSMWVDNVRLVRGGP